MIESKSIALPTWRYPNIEMTFLVVLKFSGIDKAFLNPDPIKPELVGNRNHDNPIAPSNPKGIRFLRQLAENVFRG